MSHRLKLLELEKERNDLQGVMDVDGLASKGSPSLRGEILIGPNVVKVRRGGSRQTMHMHTRP